MIGITANLTWGPSRPIEELNRLIVHRCGILYENAKDAAIATVINTAAGLRAQTRKARPAGKTDPKIAQSVHYKPSWAVTGSIRRKCIRDASGERVRFPNMRVIYRTCDESISCCQVFLVTPEHERDKPYIIVTLNRKDAEKYEQVRSRRRKEALGGLAKFTLGLAMAKLSTRNQVKEAGGKVGMVAPKYASASAQNEGKALSVELRSALNYAIDALKDGKGSVDVAMMKAANKTYGILQRAMKNWSSPVDIGPVPFPEIVGKRSAT